MTTGGNDMNCPTCNTELAPELLIDILGAVPLTIECGCGEQLCVREDLGGDPVVSRMERRFSRIAGMLAARTATLEVVR
jgi:hypothetical protein